MADWGDPADLTRLRLSFRSSNTGGGAAERCITVAAVAAAALAAEPC